MPRALRKFSTLLSKCAQKNWSESYNFILASLQLSSLSSRRNRSKLVLIFKFVNKLIHLPPNLLQSVLLPSDPVVITTPSIYTALSPAHLQVCCLFLQHLPNFGTPFLQQLRKSEDCYPLKLLFVSTTHSMPCLLLFIVVPHTSLLAIEVFACI